MLPHQERVVEEKRELDEKLEKLNSFFSTTIFSKLNEFEQEKLNRQYSYMLGYSNVLKERIDNF